ncbi:MAG: hypothetical protein H7X97_02310 [Opitutaceae bacterium]|nr:hypothetical protein [Verrucomicrobiales bacterium]
MNEPSHRLRQRTEEQSTAEQVSQHQQSQAAREFASVEELIRHDAGRTPVPEAVADRLKQSMVREPSSKPTRWWRRLLGG